MTKEELTEALLLKTNLTRENMQSYYSLFAARILRDILKGLIVNLGNFGKFYSARRAAKRIFNRHTRTFVISPARKIAKFAPHERLRQRVGG